jgi:hypothetical protein
MTVGKGNAWKYFCYVDTCSQGEFAEVCEHITYTMQQLPVYLSYVVLCR